MATDPSNGTLPEYGSNDNSIPGAIKPRTPDYGSTLKNQLGTAKSYLANLKANSDNLYGGYAKQARDSLSKSLTGVRDDYNARGLLNSGLEKGAEAGQISATNQNLDTVRSNINQGLLSNVSQLEGNAFGTGAVAAQPGPSTASPYLSGVSSNITGNGISDQLSGQALGNAIGGVGAIGGLGLAGLMQGNGQNLNLNNLSQTNGTNYNPYSPLSNTYA